MSFATQLMRARDGGSARAEPACPLGLGTNLPNRQPGTMAAKMVLRVLWPAFGLVCFVAAEGRFVCISSQNVLVSLILE